MKCNFDFFMARWLRIFGIQSLLYWQMRLLTTYKHLILAYIYQFHAFMKHGHIQSQITRPLDQGKSNIYGELGRNSDARGYRPRQAREFAANPAQNSYNAQILSPWVRKHAAAL